MRQKLYGPPLPLTLATRTFGHYKDVACCYFELIANALFHTLPSSNTSFTGGDKMPRSHSCAPPFHGPEAGLPHTLWGFLLLKLRSKPQEEKGVEAGVGKARGQA